MLAAGELAADDVQLAPQLAILLQHDRAGHAAAVGLFALDGGQHAAEPADHLRCLGRLSHLDLFDEHIHFGILILRTRRVDGEPGGQQGDSRQGGQRRQSENLERSPGGVRGAAKNRGSSGRSVRSIADVLRHAVTPFRARTQPACDKLRGDGPFDRRRRGRRAGNRRRDGYLAFTRILTLYSPGKL